MTKVLIVSSGNPRTGFGRVAYELINNLILDINIDFIPYDQEVGIKTLVPSLKMHVPPANDFWGRKTINTLVSRTHYSKVLVIQDPWYCFSIKRELNQPCVLYMAVDGDNFSKEEYFKNSLPTNLVVFTKFAKKIIANKVESIENIAVIPHGVNREVFYPLSGEPKNLDEYIEFKGRAKTSLSNTAGFNISPNDILITNINKNQPRKRLDLTLKIFLEERKRTDNLKLILTNCSGSDEELDVMGFVSANKLSNSVFYLPDNGVNDELVNLIYNATDIGLNTSSHEGWGLTCFENAACFSAQVIGKHSAHEEIWLGLETMVEMVDEAKSQEIITRLIDDIGFRFDMSRKAFQIVNSKRFDWIEISENIKNIVVTY